MWRCSSVMKDWQKRMISSSDLPFGSKSEPPLPPPIGRPVRECLKICSKPDRKSTRLNSSHVATSYAVFIVINKNADGNLNVFECVGRLIPSTLVDSMYTPELRLFPE